MGVGEQTNLGGGLLLHFDRKSMFVAMKLFLKFIISFSK